jgi:hypothetical protein
LTKTLDIAPDQSLVIVRLVKDTVTKKISLEVALRSCKRRGLWADFKLDPDNSKLEYAVAKAAETLASHQCEKYGDKHNPPDVAKKAVEALHDLMRSAERARTRPDPGKSSIEQAFS